MPQQQETNKAQTTDDTPAAAPKSGAKVVEQARIKAALELGVRIGRVEKTLESIQEKFAELPGGMPERVQAQWNELEKKAEQTIGLARKSAINGSAITQQLESQFREVNSALSLIDGLIETRTPLQAPRIGLPTGSVIAYDPEDIAGVAALSTIIKLSQNPEEVQKLADTLGIERKGNEPLGKSIQRSMMSQMRELNPPQEKGSEAQAKPALPQQGTLEQNQAGDFLKPRGK